VSNLCSLLERDFERDFSCKRCQNLLKYDTMEKIKILSIQYVTEKLGS